MRRKKISISIKKESLSRADKSQLIRLLKYQSGLPAQRKRTPNLPMSCDIFLKGSSWQKMARILTYFLKKNVIDELSYENIAQETPIKVSMPYSVFRRVHGGSISERNVIVKLVDGSRCEVLASLSNHARTEVNRDQIRMIKGDFMIVKRMSDKFAKYLSSMGATLVPDIPLGSPSFPTSAAEGDSHSLDLISSMGIRELHKKGITGKGTYIAFFDQGVESSPELRRKRFCGGTTAIKSANKKAFLVDNSGNSHGTICAGIAAGRPTKRFLGGVAPDAGLISVQVSPDFRLSDIIGGIDYLISWFKRKRMKGPVIVCNSWGWNKITSPGSALIAYQFLDSVISDALDLGMVFSFSAGNNHNFVRGMFHSCGPNSIWFPFKTLSDVLVVGAYHSNNGDYSLSNGANFEVSQYSSRGPGEQYSDPGHSKKPDLVMPAPDRVQVLKKNGPAVQGFPWLTSGANAFMSGVLSLYASDLIINGKGWRFDRNNLQTFLRIIRSYTKPLVVGAVCPEAQGGGYLNWP